MRKFLVITLCLMTLAFFTAVSAGSSDEKDDKDGKDGKKGGKKDSKKKSNPKGEGKVGSKATDGDSESECSEEQPDDRRNATASSGSAGATTLGCVFVATIAAISML